MITTYGAIFDGGFNNLSRFWAVFGSNPKNGPLAHSRIACKTVSALDFANDTAGVRSRPIARTAILSFGNLSNPASDVRNPDARAFAITR